MRNIAVDEVDCRGKNLPIFLNSLKEGDFKKFCSWTERHLGFIIEKSISEGHISLKIRKSYEALPVNLSDSGFGYSQILPIITQLWYITSRNRDLLNSPITIAIEQPELHLHPSLQAKLIDAIVEIIKNSKNSRKIIFIIETHSETIIRRFGRLIYNENSLRKNIEKEDIAIYLFNKALGEDYTEIKVSKFDEDGYLENWPIGFFDPGEVF